MTFYTRIASQRFAGARWYRLAGLASRGSRTTEPLQWDGKTGKKGDRGQSDRSAASSIAGRRRRPRLLWGRRTDEEAAATPDDGALFRGNGIKGTIKPSNRAAARRGRFRALFGRFLPPTTDRNHDGPSTTPTTAPAQRTASIFAARKASPPPLLRARRRVGRLPADTGRSQHREPLRDCDTRVPIRVAIIQYSAHSKARIPEGEQGNPRRRDVEATSTRPHRAFPASSRLFSLCFRSRSRFHSRRPVICRGLAEGSSRRRSGKKPGGRRVGKEDEAEGAETGATVYGCNASKRPAERPHEKKKYKGSRNAFAGRVLLSL